MPGNPVRNNYDDPDTATTPTKNIAGSLRQRGPEPPTGGRSGAAPTTIGLVKLAVTSDDPRHHRSLIELALHDQPCSGIGYQRFTTRRTSPGRPRRRPAGNGALSAGRSSPVTVRPGLTVHDRGDLHEVNSACARWWPTPIVRACAARHTAGGHGWVSPGTALGGPGRWIEVNRRSSNPVPAPGQARSTEK